jgi:hypothetical protein
MMTDRDLRRMITQELQSAPEDGAANLAADVVRLAAVGLVEILRSPDGEVIVAPRES